MSRRARRHASGSAGVWTSPCKGQVSISSTEGVDMLENTDAVANVAVKDLAVARKFYEGTLGLTPVDTEGEEVVVFRSGRTLLNVYRSDYAGTNQATAVTWTVGDQVEEIVRELGNILNVINH
jgi:hypothetical protein